MNRHKIPTMLVSALEDWLTEDREEQHGRTISNVLAIIEDEGASGLDHTATLARITARVKELESERP